MKTKPIILSILIVMSPIPALSLSSDITQPCLSCPDGTISPCCTTLCCDNTGGGGLITTIDCEPTCRDMAGNGWTNVGTGYQKAPTFEAEGQTDLAKCKCIVNGTRYRCASGYYGTSTNGTSGCTQCPQWSSAYTNSARTTLARGTSSAGATEITGCFVAAGTYYDVTGTFTITSNCAYTK